MDHLDSTETDWHGYFDQSAAHRKPIQRFDEFVTVDWVQDTLKTNKAQFHEDKHLTEQGLTSSNTTRINPFLDKLLRSCESWIVLTLMGVMIGFIAASLSIITEFMGDIKTGRCSSHFYLNRSFCCWGEGEEASCKDWVPWSSFGFFNYVIFVLISIALALTAAILVKHYAPSAAGSGISEIKCIVSGFVMENFLGWWTLLVKSIALPLAISSGLSVGKEGPSVHYAACVGNCVPSLFTRFRRSASSSRQYLTAASAAGVAVAFASPMGGVLFSIEEISSVFQLSSMWKSYFCALIATGVMAAMNPFRTGQIVIFEVTYDQNWHLFEVPFFIILGIFGGVYGIVVSKLNVRVVAFRQKFLKNHAIREVVILATLTAMIGYFNEFLRLDMTKGMEILFHECGADWDHDLCSKDKNNVKFFFSLAFATVMRMVLVIISYGCKVPAGIFVPSMAAGATFGRALGLIVESLESHYPEMGLFDVCKAEGSSTCVISGTYAFLGAAAALSGITNLHATVVVVMFELTGAVRYILPTMIVVGVTKTIGDRWGHGGIADQMIRFNGLPFIDAKEEHEFNTSVSQAMSNAVVAIPARGLKYKDLEALLMDTTYVSFPIVVSELNPSQLGFINRADIIKCINEEKASGVVIDTHVECVFVSEGKQQSLTSETQTLPKKDSFELESDGAVISFEKYVNLAPLTVPSSTPLEVLLNIFHKLGPRVVFVEDSGQLSGLITRKDIVKYELYLHDLHHGSHGESESLQGQSLDDKVWDIICLIGEHVSQLKARILEKLPAQRYLRLSNAN
ncbi:unnamed protein product [Kuraishia capsulata CBS 1993]|uniref:Chloride channel protein n=1 Tax=Kuraishia capsulata CBS 1993 TaxID=1382522 RepID=W6MJA8_9ASCO|nr:uncharacterized protein KUCA_T00002582001 [Kuraishia capsulata CBS 1993]CDK26609.1 unnamed protein product [Kuraishia capsulata CBS 1993]